MNQNTDTTAAPQIPPCSAEYAEAEGATPPSKPWPETAADVDLSDFRPNEQKALHRGPYEAGAANRYYGAMYRPNFTYLGRTFNEDEMTSEQKALYEQGWNEETERKDWN